MRTALVSALPKASALLAAALFLAPAAFAQTPAKSGDAASPIGQILDSEISTIEREVLGLAQKMPAEAYDFAPSTGTPPKGTFDGVRTFGQQVRHIATVMYNFAGRALNEKPPVDTDGPDENGPVNLKTKDESIAYFQGALAYAHKAMRSLKADTPQQQLNAAAFIPYHTNDHYGQMVVYARLNGVVPGNGPNTGQAKGKGPGALKGKGK